MKLTVVDNGLTSNWGHSYMINKAIKARIAEIGIETTLYTFSGVEPKVRDELGCVPHFRHSLYDYGPASSARWVYMKLTGAEITKSLSETKSARALNASFRDDLERLPQDVWDLGNLVLFTGLTQHQIVGLAEFAAARSDFAAKVVCQLMFMPDWLPWGQKAHRGDELYGKAFRLLNSQIGRHVFFTTENEHVAKFYLENFNVPSSILPVPLSGAKRGPQNDGRIRLGFFGYSKVEKGFHLLPEAIDLCRNARADLEFTIQVQHHQTEEAVIAAEKVLRHIPGVRLIDGALDTERFAAETGSIDVMLLPYDPALFGLRGSGLFVESVSGGRLIVASKDIWAGRKIDAGEAFGETFAPYTGRAFGEAILRLCDRRAGLSAQAIDGALQFAQKNSIEKYVNTVLSVGQQAVA